MTAALLAGLVTIGAPPTAGSSGAERGPVRSWLTSTRERSVAHPPELAHALRDEAEAGRHAASAGRASTGREATVVVEAVDAEAARAAIRSAGGTVDLALGDVVKALVPTAALDALAASDGVQRVRKPNPIRPSAVSEGVNETQADAWHLGGATGAGTKIAVLDRGFTGYASRLGTELPATTATDFTRCAGTFDEHGTAVAEITYDMAPGAELLLVCVEDDVDFTSALDSMAGAGVDIVHGSFGFLLNSRGDGSGGVDTVNGAVAKLRDQGILYTASAGNYGDRHFNVNATGDPTPAVAFPNPGSSFGDFVNISDGDALTVTVPGNGTVFVGMQWDAWPTTRQDFDLYAGNNFCGEEGASEGDQASSPGGPPVEALEFTNCSGSTQVFEIIVNRWSGSGTQRLDFFFAGDIFGIEHTSGGGIPDPASSPAAVAVGAHCEATGAIQPYSSRGPTIDGRTKPDISGPDGTTGSVYGAQSGCQGGFTGTSASAPHVAGAAALLLGANPGLDVAELQQLLEDKALDAGAAGDDNTFGAGKLRLGSTVAALTPTPQPFTGITPVRLFDSRPGAAFPSESPNRTTPIGPGGKVRVQVRNIVGVPADATAVVLNVTAVTPTAAGFVTVHPGGTVPNASNLNFAAGQTAAVHVTATVAPDHKIELVNAVGSTHLIVDIAGWYGPTGTGGPSTERLTMLPAPARALDSRPGSPQGYAEGAFGSGGRTTPIPEGGDLAVQVAGLGGVPAEATAVVMNVTAVAPSKGTFLIVYPQGEAVPLTSNLNAKPTQTVANLVVMPVGDGGRVRFYNQLGNTHLVVDVAGWFQPATGAGYVALDPPTRGLDTRSGNGLRRTPLGVNGTHKLKVARYNGVPADAAAVMLGVVAVNPAAASWLTVYPGTAGLPNTSNLNFAAGVTIANAVVARLGTDGTVAFNNARGSTHVVSDLAGYFIDPANVPIP